MRALLLPVLMAPMLAAAQAYKPTPRDECSSLASPRIGPYRSTGPIRLPDDVLAQMSRGREMCEQAVQETPTGSPWLYGNLARARAFTGDARGALEAARKGAEQNSTLARAVLGVLLATGEVVMRDYPAARDQFRRAAKEGSPHAAYNAGVLAANGWAGEKDESDALAAFTQAARGGDPLAMQVLGQRYEQPEWLRKAAEAMDPEIPGEPLRLARAGRAELDTAALVAVYRDKAKTEPWAQAYLGLLYEAGQWLPRDAAAAAAWYRRAAEARYVPAQWRLALLYRHGRGVPQDLAEARHWSERWEVQRCEEHELAEAGANACDRLAADGYDPDRVASGVDSFCMRHFARRAIVACTAAVKQSPKTARYHSQLARALAHTGRFDDAQREARAAASAGSTSAMILLGVMRQRGLGGPQDAAAAQTWYARAADGGNARGAALSGRPRVQAAMAPAAAAAAGNPREQFNLAASLEREKKYDEALAWYERAAAQGFRPAELNLAQMYEKGIGVRQDSDAARGRYRKLAAVGDGEARYRAARLAANAGDTAEALRLYERGAKDDELRSILDLGELYEQGRGVPRNLPRASEYYERAAERSRWARFKLGALALEGKDYAKAQYWLRRSAAEGHPGAKNNLGWMHEHGLGTKVDFGAAREQYHAALAAGSDEAKGNLERLYAGGLGAPAGAAALDWYRMGAEAGISSAQYRLGMMYARGETVARDERLAAEWLTKAAQHGHAAARREAAEIYYRLGDDVAAAALGHEGAARRLATRMAAAGQPDAAAELRRRLAAGPPQFPPAPVWPQGISTNAGDDQLRTIAVRIAGVGSMQAAAVDAGIANVYDVIRWFPETDGKK